MAYYVYITTNQSKSTVYVGMTNDLPSRILEHGLNAGKQNTFAGKYYCNNLLYYEEYDYVNEAIYREKQIKKWRRDKKDSLVATINPKFLFLNQQLGLYPFGDYSDERNIELRRQSN